MKKVLFFITLFVMGMAIMPNVYAEEIKEVNDERTLKEAIEALSSTGGVINLKNNITTEGLITINTDKAITINLNNFKLDRKNPDGNTMLNITKGEVTIKGDGTVEITNGNAIIANGADVKVILDGGNYNSSTEGQNSILIQNGASITVKGNANIKGYYGITVFNDNSKIDFENGNIEAVAFAISGNGSDTTNSIINIKGGTIKSELGTAIYQPQTGHLNISGGNITGPIAIVARQGEINITGGTINATGDPLDTVAIGVRDVELPLGTAVVVDNTEASYADNATVKISGGVFKTKSDNPVISFDDDPNDITVEQGATFDKKVNPIYLEEGLIQDENGKVIPTSSLTPIEINTTQEEIENPDTSDINIYLLLGLLAISVFGLGYAIRRKIK